MIQVQLTESQIHEVGTRQLHPLGTVGVSQDGKKYRYVKAGGAIAAGKIAAVPPNVANHIDRAPGANVAVGATELTVAIGATAVAQDDYAGGTLIVEDGSGEGQTFRVLGNTASAGSTSITVKLATPVKTALVASADSKVSLFPSKYNGVVASATVAFRRVGVPNVAFASGEYGWVQTSGDCAVLIDGSAVAIADPVIPGSVAGSVAGIGTAAVTDQIVGYARQAGTDTEYQLIDLQLD